nr:MAG TPA: hypothetical protein [Caudoviricetes sp.]
MYINYCRCEIKLYSVRFHIANIVSINDTTKD